MGETLEEAKKRFVVRIETYIELSMETAQNFLLVTHADAVAAAMQMFERGFADISNMEFCARIFANREVKQRHHDEQGVYADQWDISSKGVTAQIAEVRDRRTKKYFEQIHLDECQ